MAEPRPERVRLFVATDLPPEARDALVAWQERQFGGLDDLRITRSLHVTLCFLGPTLADRLPQIEAALRTLSLPALPSGLAEPLFLPERGRHKNVIALRVEDPSGALVRLQQDVSDVLASLGVYRPEKRTWLPHLTVARFRRPGLAFSLQNVNSEAFCLPSIILYSSVLERGGAVHTPLATIPSS